MSIFPGKPKQMPDIPVREFLERIIDERDRQYEARFRAAEIAVEAALLAEGAKTKDAFASSEKAIDKAEEAQREYNQRSNEFRGQLDDQAKLLMARVEALSLFGASDNKLETMRAFFESRLDSQRESLEKSIESVARELASQRTYTVTLITPQQHEELIKRIGVLEQANANAQGKVWAVGVFLTVLTIIISVVLHFIP